MANVTYMNDVTGVSSYSVGLADINHVRGIKVDTVEYNALYQLFGEYTLTCASYDGIGSGQGIKNAKAYFSFPDVFDNIGLTIADEADDLLMPQICWNILCYYCFKNHDFNDYLISMLKTLSGKATSLLGFSGMQFDNYVQIKIPKFGDPSELDMAHSRKWTWGVKDNTHLIVSDDPLDQYTVDTIRGHHIEKGRVCYVVPISAHLGIMFQYDKSVRHTPYISINDKGVGVANIRLNLTPLRAWFLTSFVQTIRSAYSSDIYHIRSGVISEMERECDEVNTINSLFAHERKFFKDAIRYMKLIYLVGRVPRGFVVTGEATDYDILCHFYRISPWIFTHAAVLFARVVKFPIFVPIHDTNLNFGLTPIVSFSHWRKSAENARAVLSLVSYDQATFEIEAIKERVTTVPENKPKPGRVFNSRTDNKKSRKGKTKYVNNSNPKLNDKNVNKRKSEKTIQNTSSKLHPPLTPLSINLSESVVIEDTERKHYDEDSLLDLY